MRLRRGADRLLRPTQDRIGISYDASGELLHPASETFINRPCQDGMTATPESTEASGVHDDAQGAFFVLETVTDLDSYGRP